MAKRLTDIKKLMKYKKAKKGGKAFLENMVSYGTSHNEIRGEMQ